MEGIFNIHRGSKLEDIDEKFVEEWLNLDKEAQIMEILLEEDIINTVTKPDNMAAQDSDDNDAVPVDQKINL